MVPHPFLFSTLWYQVCNSTGVVEPGCRERGCGYSSVRNHVPCLLDDRVAACMEALSSFWSANRRVEAWTRPLVAIMVLII